MQRPRVVLPLCLTALLLPGCELNPPPSLPDIAPAPLSSPGWKVIRRYSANQALIVDVETRDRARAVAIAEEIVEPVKDSYVEVLVYVRPIGSTATRRVQWTKKTGEYRILDF